MVSNETANAIVDAMLGWLKGFADWVLRLFDLAIGGSPLEWLSKNWLWLLTLLLIAGVVIDLLVWLIRWRPYWVWFGKKRVIINDDKFFAIEKLKHSKHIKEDELLSAEWSKKPAARKKKTVKKKKPAHEEDLFLTDKKPAKRSSGKRI